VSKVATLARILRIEEQNLMELADGANRYYRVARVEKKHDGSRRITFDAKPPLKSVQARINCLILRHVTYPPYLHGGIRDASNPKDYVSAARVHQYARTLVSEDIHSFFPSVCAEVIRNIWTGPFHFPQAVAECLTKLTTKDGSLPQGAKTSTALANLVFWRDEPSLVAYFRSKGIAYTRFVDDINCSSKALLTRAELADVIGRLHAMCGKYGLHLKRTKHRISLDGSRMAVFSKDKIKTGLIVNCGVSLSHQERSAIRAHVRQLELLAAEDGNRGPVFAASYRSLSGRVGKLKRFHPREAQELRRRLRAIAP
jgi:hypothetical protein